MAKSKFTPIQLQEEEENIVSEKGESGRPSVHVGREGERERQLTVEARCHLWQHDQSFSSAV